MLLILHQHDSLLYLACVTFLNVPIKYFHRVSYLPICIFPSNQNTASSVYRYLSSVSIHFAELHYFVVSTNLFFIEGNDNYNNRETFCKTAVIIVDGDYHKYAPSNETSCYASINDKTFINDYGKPYKI